MNKLTVVKDFENDTVEYTYEVEGVTFTSSESEIPCSFWLVAKDSEASYWMMKNGNLSESAFAAACAQWLNERWINARG